MAKGLDEESTSPLYGGDGLLTKEQAHKALSKVLVRQPYGFMFRAIPFVDSVKYLKTLEVVEIYVRCRAPFRDPSNSTLEGLRCELNIYADMLYEFVNTNLVVYLIVD